MSDAQQRDHFEVFASILDCIVRYYWQDGPAENKLGISFDGDTLTRLGALDSSPSITSSFNEAAASAEAGKKES